MEETEAREISKAYADVAEYYPSMKMNGETAAVLNFVAIVSVNYGARFMAYRLRTKAERAKQVSGRETPIHSTPVPPPPTFTTQPSPAPMTEKPVMTKEVRTGEIPGVGSIEFPANHPLMGGAAKGNA